MQASRIRPKSAALRALHVLSAAHPSARAASFHLVLMAFFAVGLTACGHRATKEECEEIFRRSAELALAAKNVHEPKEVEEQTERARLVKGDKMMTECVGLRITDAAMECVRKASSPQQLEACID